MAKRGDVLVARRRLGFGAEGKREHFLVVQSDLLAGIETVVVAPMDEDGALYDDDPLVVRVAAKEVGTKSGQVVLVHLLLAAALTRFEQASTGRLSAKSMALVESSLRTVLHL